MEVNRNLSVYVVAHEHASSSIGAAPSGDLSKNGCNKKDGRSIVYDVLYAEVLKLEDMYDVLTLFYSDTYKVKMKVATELTIICPIVS